MTATTLAGRIARFMDVPADNPELLKAQYAPSRASCR